MASAILTFTDLGGFTMRRVGGSKVVGQASKMPASLSVDLNAGAQPARRLFCGWFACGATISHLASVKDERTRGVSAAA
jgi:hypothetical protein